MSGIKFNLQQLLFNYTLHLLLIIRSPLTEPLNNQAVTQTKPSKRMRPSQISFKKNFNQLNICMTKTSLKSATTSEQQHQNTHSTPDTQYIGGINQALEVLRFNKFILTGYRINYSTIKSILRSLFHIHNETVNIWSHLIGFILVLMVIFDLTAYDMEKGHVLAKVIARSFSSDIIAAQNIWVQNGKSELATWPITLCLIGSAICLGCSSFYHLTNSMSENIFKVTLGTDFLGIGINMALSPVPFFYYSAYCDSTLFKNYLIFGISLGLLVFVLVSAVDTIKYNQYKTLRKMVTPLSGIVSMGGLAKLLFDYFLYENNGDSYDLIPGVYLSLTGAFCFFCGFAFYGFRFPECCRPGKYDICGSSHQILHFFGLLGMLFVYLGALVCYEMRSSSLACPAN